MLGFHVSRNICKFHALSFLFLSSLLSSFIFPLRYTLFNLKFFFLFPTNLIFHLNVRKLKFVPVYSFLHSIYKCTHSKSLTNVIISLSPILTLHVHHSYSSFLQHYCWLLCSRSSFPLKIIWLCPFMSGNR